MLVEATVTKIGDRKNRWCFRSLDLEFALRPRNLFLLPTSVAENVAMELTCFP
jgi:hypothetical protein